MDPKTLEELLSKAETHQKIVGDYGGAYALGVARPPQAADGPLLVLRVATGDISQFPDRVELRGETIPIEVQANFRPPVPLGGTSPA